MILYVCEFNSHDFFQYFDFILMLQRYVIWENNQQNNMYLKPYCFKFILKKSQFLCHRLIYMYYHLISKSIRLIVSTSFNYFFDYLLIQECEVCSNRIQLVIRETCPEHNDTPDNHYIRSFLLKLASLTHSLDNC